MTVVAAVNRSGGEKVLIEAAARAADRKTDLHVVYVLPLGKYGLFELKIAERVGIPVQLDLFRTLSENIADGIAAPIVDDYIPVGLIGDPESRIIEYAGDVDAELIVIDGNTRKEGARGMFGASVNESPETDIPIVPVY